MLLLPGLVPCFQYETKIHTRFPIRIGRQIHNDFRRGFFILYHGIKVPTLLGFGNICEIVSDRLFIDFEVPKLKNMASLLICVVVADTLLYKLILLQKGLNGLVFGVTAVSR